MSLINNFDPSLDFWKSNPQLKILFSDYSKTPSEVMWAVMLYCHPDSKLFNESPLDRTRIIDKDYLSKPLDWKKYSDLIKFTEQKVLTKAQKLLRTWEQKLHERDDLIASVPYDLSTYEALDKMLAVTPKLWDQYFSILKLLQAEEETHVRGDQEESLTEKGLI